MIRVLHVVGALECGGIGMFLMNHYKKIDRNKVQFDFIVHGNKEVYFEKEILALGGKIYRVPAKSENMIGNVVRMIDIITSNKYKIIHIHTAGTSSWINACISRIMGVKKVIIHSHGSFEMNSKAHNIFKPLLNIFATDYIACSTKAGEWLYGEKKMQSNKVKIINNAIDSEKFKFSLEKRILKRKELGLNNSQIVLGHIGRFSPEKNHPFLIEVFKKVKIYNDNVVLYLIGNGNEEEYIRSLVRKYELEKSVKFLGIRDDIEELLQIMDVFVFPSKYEGLPISLVEAQAAGVKCIVSDNISEEVKITPCIEFLSLTEEEKWVKSILDSIQVEDCRDQQSNIKIAGFDINSNIKYLQEIYNY